MTPAKRGELLDLLRLDAFALLDDDFARLRESLRRDVRWEGTVAGAYLAFSGPEDDILDLLDGWVTHSGSWSPSPWAARAFFWWSRAVAWNRERRWVGDDTEARQARDDAYRRGRDDARRAIEIDPDDLGGHLALITLRGIYDWSESAQPVLDAALTRFPASYRLREEALWGMRPRMKGSHELMQAVVDEAQAHVDVNPRLAELRGMVALDQAATFRDAGSWVGSLRKLDEAEELGLRDWVHLDRSVTWARALDPVRALAAADSAVARQPVSWRVLEHRARVLSWIAKFATVYQLEGILAQALADQDDALALQPMSREALAHRAWIASFHADCAHSTARCFSHSLLGTDEPSEVTDPESWWLRLVMFVVGIPLTLLLVLIEGERYYLLPLPLAALWAIGWNWVEWRRHTYWVPLTVHVMAVLAFLMIVGINVAWVRAGGTMWTQRYVVVVVCVLVPYLVYLTLGGPRWMAYRGHVPAHRRRRPKGAETPAPQPERQDP